VPHERCLARVRITAYREPYDREVIGVVPPMRLQYIHWGHNTPYATRRATITEIEAVLFDPQSAFRRNLPGRAATHIAIGRTQAGRRLTVAFIYMSNTRTAIPINAWENR
jgi:hypothetical protein